MLSVAFSTKEVLLIENVFQTITTAIESGEKPENLIVHHRLRFTDEYEIKSILTKLRGAVQPTPAWRCYQCGVIWYDRSKVCPQCNSSGCTFPFKPDLGPEYKKHISEKVAG